VDYKRVKVIWLTSDIEAATYGYFCQDFVILLLSDRILETLDAYDKVVRQSRNIVTFHRLF
jgi:hypothetical protein